MTRTSMPLMLHAVEQDNYKIVVQYERSDLEGKIVLSIECNVNDNLCRLTRHIKETSPLKFLRSARLEVTGNEEFADDVNYYHSENITNAEDVFKVVEDKNPEYLRTCQ